ncbi:unnamed protein product [Caenorhabditis bovis]|uniref:BLOC-1-related complex subunit 5 n=1 Tax=Caenorhabditis bovis TaxID=2654633 RepID=A0A8S1ET07_9PELO|nr:unnamed protein product [Caenorhabditis bovis]
MSFVPSEVRIDHTYLKWDKEWIFQRLPKDEVIISRDFEPDIEADTIPGSVRQEPVLDPNLTWRETARTSTKRSKGIVVVKDGVHPQQTIEDDEIYKRFCEIPRFLPIIPSVLGKKDTSNSTTYSAQKLSSRPFFKLANRFQEHLNICAKSVTADQSKIPTLTKQVENRVTKLYKTVKTQKQIYDDFVESLLGLSDIHNEIIRIELLLKEIVPMVETLNELLVPEDRLPPLNLGKVLDRSAVPSSESSLESTPRRRPNAENIISPIEEIQVRDIT